MSHKLGNVSLSHLTEEERNVILGVLDRDEDLQDREMQRVRKLRSEIKAIKLEGVIRTGVDADKTCGRCRKPFGWIFNTGALCPRCQHRVCDTCRVHGLGDTKWMCRLCQKQMELEAMSGTWFYMRWRKSKRHKKSNKPIHGNELVKSSFKRPHRQTNGTANSVNEEVKRVLSTNNNGAAAAGDGAGGSGTSPSPSPSRRHPGALHKQHSGESSDTQSMEAMQSPTRGRPRIDDAAFPRDSDKALLRDLIGAKPLLLNSASPRRTPEPPPPHTVHIKHVSSQRYASDSDDSDAGTSSLASSPPLSVRTSDSTFQRSASVRSSLRSTSAPSSEGRITLVTDNASVISDISTAPPSMAEGGVSPGQQRHPMVGVSPTPPTPGTPRQGRNSPGNRSPSPDAGYYGNSKSSSSPSPSQQQTSKHTAELYTTTRVRRRRSSSSSSDDDPDNLNVHDGQEATRGVARGAGFARMPSKSSSHGRSASPRSSSRTPTPQPSPGSQHRGVPPAVITEQTEPGVHDDIDDDDLIEEAQARGVIVTPMTSGTLTDDDAALEVFRKRSAATVVVVGGGDRKAHEDLEVDTMLALHLAPIQARLPPADEEKANKDLALREWVANNPTPDQVSSDNASIKSREYSDSSRESSPFHDTQQSHKKQVEIELQPVTSSSVKTMPPQEDKPHSDSDFDLEDMLAENKRHLSEDEYKEIMNSSYSVSVNEDSDDSDRDMFPAMISKGKKGAVASAGIGFGLGSASDEISKNNEPERKGSVEVDVSHMKSFSDLKKKFNTSQKYMVPRTLSDKEEEEDVHGVIQEKPHDLVKELEANQRQLEKHEENHLTDSDDDLVVIGKSQMWKSPLNVTTSSASREGDVSSSEEEDEEEVVQIQMSQQQSRPSAQPAKHTLIVDSVPNTLADDEVDDAEHITDNFKKDEDGSDLTSVSDMEDLAWGATSIMDQMFEKPTHKDIEDEIAMAIPLVDDAVEQQRNVRREQLPRYDSLALSDTEEEEVEDEEFRVSKYIMTTTKLKKRSAEEEEEEAAEESEDVSTLQPAAYQSTETKGSRTPTQSSASVSRNNSSAAAATAAASAGSTAGSGSASSPSLKKSDSTRTRSSTTSSVPSISVTQPDRAGGHQDTTSSLGGGTGDATSQASTRRSHTNLLTPLGASTESMTSFYSDAGEGNYGKVAVTGEIQFWLHYNYRNSQLEVHVKQCRGLAAVDPKKKRSDPYVKTYLLPDRTKNGKRKTRVKKHTLNPAFDETIKYMLTKSEVETRTLWLAVWHHDTFGRNDFLGEVNVPLDYYEFSDQPNYAWHRLQERRLEPKNPTPMSLLTYKGDLNMSIKFVTPENVSSTRKVKGRSGNKGELHVLVKQARNLTAVRANGSSDPFIKGYLLPEKTVKNKQKTQVVKRNCNPEWNHTFVFEDVGWEELRERCLELSVWDHDRFTSNDFLGGVRLGLGNGTSYSKDVEWNDSKGEEISIWQSMLDRPNYWIQGTLLLRPNMDRRK